MVVTSDAIVMLEKHDKTTILIASLGGPFKVYSWSVEAEWNSGEVTWESFHHIFRLGILGEMRILGITGPCGPGKDPETSNKFCSSNLVIVIVDSSTVS